MGLKEHLDGDRAVPGGTDEGVEDGVEGGVEDGAK